MTILLIIGLGGIVLLLLAAAVLLPGKGPASVPSSHDSPSREPAPWIKLSPGHEIAQLPPPDIRSLRDRQLDEEAAAIAGEYRRISNERYLDSLRSDAAAYFSAPTTSKKSAT